MALTDEIVLVSGSYGAGHDAAADEIADRLLAEGHIVRRLDVAAELPWRIGALLRRLYFLQLRLLPGTWGTTLSCLEHEGRISRIVRGLLGLLGRRLARQVEGAALVVSTHPLASQALGEGRARGRLSTPVVTYLTDASVHRLWVHPAVDLHLALHEVTARQARGYGGTTTVVVPVVRRAPVLPMSLPWPPGRPAALVVGGSCGIGQLAAAARDVAATGLMTPVVACGNNDRLRRQLAELPGVLALGWRPDLPALVAAADCVIQNAGGMTSLEALAAGTPTLTYRPIPGHGRTNAAALDRAGLVPWVRGPQELADALALALAAPTTFALPRSGRSVVDVLTELVPAPLALASA